MSQKKELKIISSTNVEVREINWLWYPFIPRGKVTILQGDPGEGNFLQQERRFQQRIARLC